MTNLEIADWLEERGLDREGEIIFAVNHEQRNAIVAALRAARPAQPTREATPAMVAAFMNSQASRFEGYTWQEIKAGLDLVLSLSGETGT